VRVLVTTYLQPSDDIDQLLRGHGHEATHRPAAGSRMGRLSCRNRLRPLGWWDVIDRSV
jgi:hypothetical protein